MDWMLFWVPLTWLIYALGYVRGRRVGVDIGYRDATLHKRCSECGWVGLLDRHQSPSGWCPNTGKVGRREDVSESAH